MKGAYTLSKLRGSALFRYNNPVELTRIEVANYKSYFHPSVVILSRGFNVITGRNNSGKTALLEAISRRISAAPHRSLGSVPAPGVAPAPETIVNVSCNLAQDELARVLLVPGSTFKLAAPQQQTEFARTIHYRAHGDNPSAINLASWLFSKPCLTFDFSILYAGGTPTPRSNTPFISWIQHCSR